MRFVTVYPTSVPCRLADGSGNPRHSITTAFTGESGSAPFPMPVRSVHVVPASIVFQTWPATPVKPMIATYAVFAEPIRQIHTNARNRRLVGIDALSHSENCVT